MKNWQPNAGKLVNITRHGPWFDYEKFAKLIADEHARLLIKALEFAIVNDFLFTEAQLAKHLTSALIPADQSKKKLGANDGRD